MNFCSSNILSDHGNLAIILGLLMDENPDTETQNIIENLVFRKLNQGATGNNIIEDDTCPKMKIDAMWIAIERGWTGIMKKLIANGYNLQQSMPDSGVTPLFYAVMQRRYAAAKCLLEAGVDPNQHPSIEFTSTYYCDTSSVLRQVLYEIEYSNADIRMLQLVLEYGAELNAEDEYKDPNRCERKILKYAKQRIATICFALQPFNFPVLIMQEICQQIMGPRFFPKNLTISWNVIKLIRYKFNNKE